ncbi:hypothetical protein Ancab_037856 [Ancistrocladus abbreviatus]
MASTPQNAPAQPATNPVANSHSTLNPSSQPPPPPLPPRESKKRPIDSVCLQDSPYFKMRLFLKDLRPLFVEVLQTPDFRDCKAALDIQEKMKLMLDLCKQMTVETSPIAKCNNTQGSRALSTEKQDGQKPVEHPQEIRPAEQTRVDQTFAKPAEERHLPSGNNSEKQLAENNTKPGTYIVGGSAFGWNFITFNGTKPVYYGRTKEAFKAAK